MGKLGDGESVVMSRTLFVASKVDKLAVEALEIIASYDIGITKQIGFHEFPVKTDVVLFTMTKEFLGFQGDGEKWFLSAARQFHLAGHHFFSDGVQMVIPPFAFECPFIIGIPQYPNGIFKQCTENFAKQYARWFKDGCIGLPWAPGKCKSRHDDPDLHEWVRIARKSLLDAGITLTQDSLIDISES